MFYAANKPRPFDVAISMIETKKTAVISRPDSLQIIKENDQKYEGKFDEVWEAINNNTTALVELKASYEGRQELLDERHENNKSEQETLRKNSEEILTILKEKKPQPVANHAITTIAETLTPKHFFYFLMLVTTIVTVALAWKYIL